MTKAEALTTFDALVEAWDFKYAEAVGCLVKDRDALLALHDFPGRALEASAHDVIESSFPTVRHCAGRSKGCISNGTALAMIFKLAEAAERSWRRLNGHDQLSKLFRG